MAVCYFVRNGVIDNDACITNFYNVRTLDKVLRTLKKKTILLASSTYFYDDDIALQIRIDGYRVSVRYDINTGKWFVNVLYQYIQPQQLPTILVACLH